MTDSEAIRDLDIIRFNPHWDELVNEEYWQELMKMAIKALEEVQQYQALEKRLSDMFGGSLSLKMCVDELERILTEPDSPHPMNAKILTYQEAADWEAYLAIGTVEELIRGKRYMNIAKRHGTIGQVIDECVAYEAIGTPEECLRNKDFLDFLSDKMNPNDFETYLRLYNALEEKGCEE